MEFTVWDIGGPASMATVNQCFFTDKALYVVVWNLALGEEAVANLQFWLLNIEVRRRQPGRAQASEHHGVGGHFSEASPFTEEKKRKRSGRNAGHLGGLSEDPRVIGHRGALKTLLGQTGVRALPVSFYLTFKSQPPTLGPKRKTELLPHE